MNILSTIYLISSRKHRALSATESFDKSGSGSQKKRMLSDSWLGKKLRIKSTSMDDDQLALNRERYSSSMASTFSSEAEDDHSHIYDIVTEFKTIEECKTIDEVSDVAAENEREAEVADDVFPELTPARNVEVKEERVQSGMEIYDSVAPDNTNVVQIVLRDDQAFSNMDNQIPEHDLETLMREADEDDDDDDDDEEEEVEVDMMGDATYNGTYIGELREDNGVEELRKMIRDSGLEFDHDGEHDEDDDADAYEKLESKGDGGGDDSAMERLRQMLGSM